MCVSWGSADSTENASGGRGPLDQPQHIHSLRSDIGRKITCWLLELHAYEYFILKIPSTVVGKGGGGGWSNPVPEHFFALFVASELGILNTTKPITVRHWALKLPIKTF